MAAQNAVENASPYLITKVAETRGAPPAKARRAVRFSSSLEYQLFVLLSVQWGTYSSALPAMKNQVRETLRLVEEVTYDLTSQSVPRPHPA